MAKLRNMLALMAVVLHLTALLVPAAAHAAFDHASGPHGEAHAQADHHAQPADACCQPTGSGALYASDGFCGICALSCTGMPATLAASGPLPFALYSTRHRPLAGLTLRSTAPEAALRPPRAHS
ncbi:MAG: hypothetical protein JJT95_14450 [Pararhodobacter sp.]|nr:hypothetical protein [Pararhodobacter sp.]